MSGGGLRSKKRHLCLWISHFEFEVIAPSNPEPARRTFFFAGRGSGTTMPATVMVNEEDTCRVRMTLELQAAGRERMPQSITGQPAVAGKAGFFPLPNNAFAVEWLGS